MASSGQSVPLFKIQDIEIYSGDPLKWQSFWDSFCHAVQEVAYLNKCPKFTYLKGFLSRAARKAIEGWSTTNLNYDAAILHLQNRFGAAESQKQALWARLLKLGKVKSEYSAAMRSLLDMKPAEDRVKAREQVALLSQLEGHSSRPTTFNTSTTVLSTNPEHSRQLNSPSYRIPNSCIFCGQSHSIWTCNEPYAIRRTTISSKRLCFNCFYHYLFYYSTSWSSNE